MTRIMIIRHAEKPSDDDLVRGVTLGGAHDKHELSVRGWQRAGALVRFFAPLEDLRVSSPISTPRSIFASAVTEKTPSLRAQRTVDPLADALGVPVDRTYAEGDETTVAAATLSAIAPVLIAWHHKRIPALARAIAGEQLSCPRRWPDDCFDVVWILDRIGLEASWSFSQAVQRLLAGDRADPIRS